MYLIRTISTKSIKSLTKANQAGDVSAVFLIEMNTTNGDYSFFCVNDINNKQSSEIMNVIIYRLARTNDERWTTNVSAVFCSEKEIGDIKELSKPETFPIGIVHKNFEEASISEAVKIIDVLFSSKETIKTYTIAEIATFIRTMTLEAWKKIFEGFDKKKAKMNCQKIVNAYFDNNPKKIPQQLSLYMQSI